jgi:glycosyltransferase involved in cell wall biosynthesis
MTKVRKTVLLVIPNLDFGGAQESFTWLSNMLNRHYHVINVVFNKEGMRPYSFQGPLLSMEIFATSHPVRKVTHFFRRVRWLRKIKARYQPDVSISFLEGADYVNILSRRKDRVIISIRGSKRNDPHIRGAVGWIRKRLLMPFLYRKADGVVAVNAGIARELKQHYGVKKPVQVIHNPFIPSKMEQGLKEELSQSWNAVFNQPVIISHSRLSAEKGFIPFLHVIAGLVKRDKPVRFLLIGDGPEYMRIVNTCHALNLRVYEARSGVPVFPDAHVYLTGYCNNPFPYLNQASVFVLPSLHEGFSNAMVEAMACGLPVVTSDCPYSPREILAPGSIAQSLEAAEWGEYGVLVPQWHQLQAAQVWTDVLMELMEDERKRKHYGNRARLRVESFNEEVVADQWENLIEEISAG